MKKPKIVEYKNRADSFKHYSKEEYYQSLQHDSIGGVLRFIIDLNTSDKDIQYIYEYLLPLYTNKDLRSILYYMKRSK